MKNKIHFEPNLWEKVFNLTQKNDKQDLHEGLLYHYTTPTGLLGILQSQNIWATEASFLNDLYEIQYGLDITNEVLTIYAQDNDSYIKKFAKQTIYYLDIINSKEEDIYITSFCETSDLLSQWKGYTNFGEGYAIGLDLKDIINSRNDASFDHVSIKKVIYTKKTQKKLIRSKTKLMINESLKLINKQKNNKQNIINASAKSLAYYLNEQSKRFKSSSFKEEKEWRAIYVNSTISKNKRIKNKFRMVGSTITPYIEINLCQKVTNQNTYLPIDKIIMGPKINFKKAEKSISLACKNLNMEIPNIKKSTISLQ